MDVSQVRDNEFIENSYNLALLKAENISKVKNYKYLVISLDDVSEIEKKLNLLEKNNISLTDKQVILQIGEKYLTKDQCNSLFKIRDLLKSKGSDLKVKDGAYWELEQVLAVSSKIDDLINKITTATVDEGGVKRPLNELEKFLWAYSFVANRKYQSNELDSASPRQLTSIFQTGDCVCAGFANILKEVCDRIGIECYINNCSVVDTGATKPDNHANNVVVIDGTAYYCDACWDCATETSSKTFTHCLISFNDIKKTDRFEITKQSAPFCDVDADLKEISDNLVELEVNDKASCSKYVQMSTKLYKYSKVIPNNLEFSPFAFKVDREELIEMHKKAIELIKQRKINKPLAIQDFEEALTNLHLARGKSIQAATDLMRADIANSVETAGRQYSSCATNCFSNEFYNNLQV